MSAYGTGLGGAVPLAGIPTVSTTSGGPATYYETLEDSVGVAAHAIYPFFLQITEIAGISVIPDAHRGFTIAVTDTAGIAATAAAIRHVLLREGLGLDDALKVTGLYGRVLTDVVAVAQALQVGRVVATAETVAVGASLAALLGLRIAETLSLADAPTVTQKLRILLQQGLRVRGTVTRAAGAAAADGLIAGDVLESRKLAIGLLTETLAISAGIVPTLLVQVVCADSIEITAQQLAGMLYSGTLVDGVEITPGFAAPDGSFTTWAMNARTGAVSEYQNYAFNSFARLGNRYIGASEAGLYELLGDDDDGDPIVARLKGGFMQFGGTHLSRLGAAYIAARGEGDFVLRILTGDGAVYNYAVSTRDMRSTKVHMGKGQRARYFAFELISAGQDFDLDTLEFVPVVVQRRV